MLASGWRALEAQRPPLALGAPPPDGGNVIVAIVGKSDSRAFDEKVESLIVDSHDGANRIQDPYWCKGGQS